MENNVSIAEYLYKYLIFLFSKISFPHHNKPKMNVSFLRRNSLLKYLTIM